MRRLCAVNPVAYKPFMNILSDGTFTDKGKGKNNPNVVSVGLVPDQFGRANMAGNWDAASDRLAWASSVGNTIATQINSKITIMFWLKGNTMSSNYRFLFNQWDGAGGDRSFYMLYINSGADVNRYQFLWVNDFDGIVSANNTYVPGVWQFITFTTKDNSTSLDIKLFVNAVLNTTANDTYLDVLNSTDELRLGAEMSGARGNFGDLNNFRIYFEGLTAGQIKLVNNQKGRIAA